MRFQQFCILFFFLLTCCITGYSLKAQPYDFTRLSLALALDTARAQVNGTISLEFIATGKVDSIYLNGIKMNYQNVMLNDKKIKYNFDDRGIWLQPQAEELKDTNVIYISYSCQPRKGIYFIGWNDKTTISKRQVWTQGQGIDHRHWIPHNDDQTDKIITEIAVSFNADYEVVSNGVLQSRQVNPENKNEVIWHYKMEKPMSSYLIALAIGKYAHKKTASNSGVPLIQYYYREREDDYPVYYYKNEEIFNFLEEEIGVPYPWKNYRQIPVQNFHHGAMENTATTIFGDFFLVDSIAFNDRNYTYVNAHELAHQWFGNLVTATNGDDHWLHEGFATYYQWLSEENIYGPEYFDWMRWKEARLVFEASVTDTVPLGDKDAGSYRFYQKGAWVLYMLNNSLGRENFQEVIKYYLNSYKFSIASTDSLVKAIAEVTSQDYTEFFHFWVHTANEPAITVKQNSLTGNILELTIDQQTVTGEPFPISSSLELWYANGFREVRKLEFKEADQLLTVKLNGKSNLLCWNFSPDMDILAKVSELKPLKMWLHQLKADKDVLDRYEAILSIKNTVFKRKTKILEAILNNEAEFFSIRAEALAQLMVENEADQLKYFKTALNSEDIQLQKEALELISDPGEELRNLIRPLRKGRSYQLRENSIHLSISMEDTLANQWIKNVNAAEEPGIPGRNVEIAILFYRVVLYKEKDALQELKIRASPGYDFITRINAMDALQYLGYFDEELVAYYFEALFDYNWKLRSKARQVLQKYATHEDARKVITNYIQAQIESWQSFHKNIINSTFDLNLN